MWSRLGPLALVWSIFGTVSSHLRNLVRFGTHMNSGTKLDQLGPLREIVALLLNEKRVELGLSYRQLAAKMDMPHQTVMRAQPQVAHF